MSKMHTYGYFVYARVIGKWQGSFIIQPIDDLVIHWLWVVGDNVIACMIKRQCTFRNGKTTRQFVIQSLNDNVAKDHGCSSGFYTRILEER